MFSVDRKLLASPWVVATSRKRKPSIKMDVASARRPRMRTEVAWPGPPRLRMSNPGVSRRVSLKLYSLRCAISSASMTLTALEMRSTVWAAASAVTRTCWSTPEISSAMVKGPVPSRGTDIFRKPGALTSTTKFPRASMRKRKAPDLLRVLATGELACCRNSTKLAPSTALPWGSRTTPSRKVWL